MTESNAAVNLHDNVVAISGPIKSVGVRAAINTDSRLALYMTPEDFETFTGITPESYLAQGETIHAVEYDKKEKAIFVYARPPLDTDERAARWRRSPKSPNMLLCVSVKGWSNWEGKRVPVGVLRDATVSLRLSKVANYLRWPIPAGWPNDFRAKLRPRINGTPRRRPGGKEHGGDEKVKQAQREALWLDRENGLLPDGVYKPGRKILLMPGSSPAEFNLLTKKRGVRPEDIVMFEINPATKANLTRVLPSGVQPHRFDNVRHAGRCILPDGPLQGKVVAGHFDFSGTPGVVAKDVVAALRSGIMAPESIFGVTYERGRVNATYAFAKHMGWLDSGGDVQYRHILTGPVHDACLDIGRRVTSVVSRPYQNHKSPMETTTFHIESTEVGLPRPNSSFARKVLGRIGALWTHLT